MNYSRYLTALAICLLCIAAPLCADTSPLGEQFESQYQRLLGLAGKRTDSGIYTRNLKAIWLATRKDLLVLDADIKARKLEAGVYEGEQQDQALNDLIALSAERERLLINGIQKLNRVDGSEAVSIPVSKPRHVADSRINAGSSSSAQAPSALIGDISIDLKPESQDRIERSNWD